MSPISVGQRLDGSDAQSTEGAAEAGNTFQGIRKGGRRCLYLRKNLHCSGTGGPAVWFVDAGDDTTHWERVGRIPSQGGLQADRMENCRGGDVRW